MQRHYPSLHDLAYLSRPALVHQIPRYLAHGGTPARRQRKVALLVLDGLAWSQWIPLRASLDGSGAAAYGIHEEGIFAWAPTVESICMTQSAYPVFIKRGDARGEVDRILEDLKRVHGSAGAAGFHKYLHVSKANQTVVMVTGRGTPLAAALRERPGWLEPTEQP